MLINQKKYISYCIIIYLVFSTVISYSCEEVFNNKSSKEKVPIETLNQRIFDYLDFDFITLKIKNQMRSIFRLSNILYIGELIQKSEQDLLQIPGFGRTQLNVAKEALEPKGLHLSTQLEEPWTRSPQKEHIAIDILNQRILDYLDFNSIPFPMRFRINRTFEANNIIYIGELIQKNEYELSYLHLETITNTFNQKIIDILVEILKQRNLHLNTTLAKSWTPPPQKEHIAIDILNQRIFDYLDFSFIDSKVSNRLKNNLATKNIHYIGELIQKSELQLLRISGISIKQIYLFEKALKPKDLHLSTQLKEPWTRPPQKKYIATDILNQRIFNYLNINFLPPQVRARIIRTFKANNILYIGELIQKSEQDLLNLRLGIIELPINKKNIHVIVEALKQRDLYLNTRLEKP